MQQAQHLDWKWNKSKGGWRINIWAPLYDFFLRDLPGLQLSRETGEEPTSQTGGGQYNCLFRRLAWPRDVLESGGGDEASHLWHGQRTSDGLPVVLKRLWTHPQAAMRELTMHLCASSVKGVVPLLDCFWEVEHGDHRMDTCFAVLVMPRLLPLTRCFPAKNTSSFHSHHHPPPTRMYLGRVREIALSLLETLHELLVKQRVVHLDMKPANLLLPLPCQQHGDDEREGWGKQASWLPSCSTWTMQIKREKKKKEWRLARSWICGALVAP